MQGNRILLLFVKNIYTIILLFILSNDLAAKSEIDYFQTELENCIDENNFKQTAHIYSNIARFHFSANQSDSAIFYIKKAYQVGEINSAHTKK